MPNPVEEFLRQGKALAGSQRKLAQRLGISEQRLSRVMNESGYPLGPWSCLRLEEFLGLAPGTVLRACGRTEIADLLERMYGKPGDSRITAHERRLLNLFRELGENDRHHVFWLLESRTKHSSRPPASPKKR